MEFKGDIIITDPCYVMKDHSDDWHKCSYGRDMRVLGINHYITESTLYGDWSCTTYKVEEDPIEIIESLAKVTKYFNDKYEEYGGYKKITDEQYDALCEECDVMRKELNIKSERIGGFCADAGLVSVFLLDEVHEYNPDFINHESRPWTTTLIKDFNGEVRYYVDQAGDAHIIGRGNINFFTTQTGL